MLVMMSLYLHYNIIIDKCITDVLMVGILSDVKIFNDLSCDFLIVISAALISIFYCPCA